MNQSHLTAWVLTISSLSSVCAQSIVAQVVPDGTLPTGERSQVSGNAIVQIDGGARRGGNLFHSFSQFSVPTGDSAYFNNAADVQNIFSRVTGGAISSIDGLIRANGTANLFLLNPNGILFGPNASLNIGGSFVATTANAIGFPNGEVFSSDATQPLPRQLLMVNPNAFFFNQLTPQPIFNQSTMNSTGLQVSPRQNLMLVGGAVRLENGRLTSPGSYVELGGVGGVGIVGLATTGEDWQLTIPDGTTRADASLSNGSVIDVTGDSGSIRMLAQNIDISESVLQIRIPRDSRLPNTQTGDLDLNATGSIALSMSSLSNDLLGQGNTGSINLTAGDQIFLDGGGINSAVRSTGVGNAGNINITTGSLALTSFSIQSHTSGRGSAGNVNINARDTVSFNDFSSVYTGVRGGGIGNAGDINVTTGALSLTNGELVSFQSGSSNAGNININARDTVSLTQNSGLNSYAIESGNAGGINVNAYNTVSLDDSRISNLVIFGAGNVGGINITTGALSLTKGADLLSTTIGQGNGGSVKINARDRVTVDGAFLPEATASYYRASRIRTRTVTGDEGQGGDVTIATGSLFLTNGGGVETSTLGRGNAGHVLINARDVQIRGTSPPFPTDRGQVSRLAPLIDYRSGVYTSATAGSVGDAGNVSINTGTLSVADQGRINTNAQGQGRAGNIQIQASDAVSFDRGDAISTLESGALGNGGNIDITARSLSVLNNAQLSASTLGEGNAGNITARADTVNVNSGGQLLTTTFSSGNAGNITVNTPNLQLSGATSVSLPERPAPGMRVT
jgi:filamentous hemagglutinin family protein